jgi:hypothetical protein
MPSGSTNSRPVQDVVGLPTIVQVLLLTSSEAAASDGATLWTVLEEVEQLYNHGRQRAVFDRRLLAAQVPPGLAEGELRDRYVHLSEQGLPLLFDHAGGVYSGTLHAEPLAELIRRRLAVPDRRSVFVLTEREIAPPEDWAYIMWWETPTGMVTSTAALDPDYWGIQESDRLKVIKHRARAACMAATGIMLGLERCNNPSCYLFVEVDSVTRLDLMVAIGPEHEEITGREAVGYWKEIEDPEVVEETAQREDLEVGGWPLL